MQNRNPTKEMPIVRSSRFSLKSMYKESENWMETPGNASFHARTLHACGSTHSRGSVVQTKETNAGEVNSIKIPNSSGREGERGISC